MKGIANYAGICSRTS